MKKADLLEKIYELEKRVAWLESQSTNKWILYPAYPQPTTNPGFTTTMSSSDNVNWKFN